MKDAQVLQGPVARPKRTGRPATSDRDDVVVKIDKHVAAKARYVAATRDIPLAEYLTEMVRALVDRDFERATKARET
jgi:hypothetical protein